MRRFTGADDQGCLPLAIAVPGGEGWMGVQFLIEKVCCSGVRMSREMKTKEKGPLKIKAFPHAFC
jgi:hypothetical protein